VYPAVDAAVIAPSGQENPRILVVAFATHKRYKLVNIV
jgi:hypothetical protein